MQKICPSLSSLLPLKLETPNFHFNKPHSDYYTKTSCSLDSMFSSLLWSPPTLNFSSSSKYYYVFIISWDHLPYLEPCYCSKIYTLTLHSPRISLFTFSNVPLQSLVALITLLSPQTNLQIFHTFSLFHATLLYLTYFSCNQIQTILY